MNATELFHKDGRSAGVHYCAKCLITHRTHEVAEQCCAPYKCSTCGVECGGSWLKCDACRNKEDQDREAQRFANAEKVSFADYAGPVFLEGTGNEGFHAEAEDLLDDLDDEEQERPAYAWACNSFPIVNITPSDIIDSLEGEAYDDWDPECLEGLDDLKIALDKFNEANAKQERWEVDYKRAVLLPKAEKAGGV